MYPVRKELDHELDHVPWGEYGSQLCVEILIFEPAFFILSLSTISSSSSRLILFKCSSFPFLSLVCPILPAYLGSAPRGHPAGPNSKTSQWYCLSPQVDALILLAPLDEHTVTFQNLMNLDLRYRLIALQPTTHLPASPMPCRAANQS